MKKGQGLIQDVIRAIRRARQRTTRARAMDLTLKVKPKAKDLTLDAKAKDINLCRKGS